MSPVEVERIDISGPLWDLCDRLGLVYENVATITFEPGIVHARVYMLNEEGSKYVNLETNEVAIESIPFLVKT